MATPDLKVVQLYESNARDPVSTLRKISDSIAAGEYGAVGSVGLVLLGDKMEVFGMGENAEAPSIAILLHAGFMRLSKSLEELGR
jgi:hypothetical protein